jgi:hypothetical protein
MCQPNRWLWLALGIAGACGPAPAAAQLPATDIWLAELRVGPDGLQVGRPENVTRHWGYDNQPAFLPDGGGFLFVRGDSTGTDVHRYDLASRRVIRLTHTAESEYSPTPLRGGRPGFDTVRVERDGTQRLWWFDADGSNPRLVLAGVDSVGYFAWLDESTVALFVVGETHTLRVVDAASARETMVARDIGRSLLRVPATGDLSFLAREPGSEPARYAFRTWRPGSLRTEWLIAAVGTGQDATWVGETLVMADGAKLFHARPDRGPHWREVIDLAAFGVTGITRVAVSRDRRSIAWVAAEAP